MGREAKCECTCAGKSGICTVLLETSELIVRGAIRRRALLTSLKDVRVTGDLLRLRAENDDITLALGADVAAKWAKAIVRVPPSLAEKLGISNESRVFWLGRREPDELCMAMREAKSVNGREPNLIVIVATAENELAASLEADSLQTASWPMWVIYRKGERAFGEAIVRDTLRERGWTDVKVASVSSEFTGLRFVRSRPLR